jgi:hypothetical protein
VDRTVFPFKDATLGPKILLAALMSSGFTRQFHIMLELTMFLKSFYDGYPTIPSARLACLAALTARLVNPSRLPLTVFTITTALFVVSW